MFYVALHLEFRHASKFKKELLVSVYNACLGLPRKRLKPPTIGKLPNTGPKLKAHSTSKSIRSTTTSISPVSGKTRAKNKWTGQTQNLLIGKLRQGEFWTTQYI